MPEITMTKTSPKPAGSADSYAVRRANMVDSQIRPSDVVDRRIIRAMGIVPREAFVPENLKAIAYMDNPVVLDRTPPMRTLMEPRLLAKLLQAAEIPDGGRVLEVGSATGYGTAVMAAMGCKAYGLEENAALATTAQQTLQQLGVTAEIRTGPFAAGLSSDGPFDAIVFSGSMPSIAPALLDQLKNGARLVAVNGQTPGSKAMIWLRSGTTYASRDAFDATAAALPGSAKPQTFVF